MLGGDWGPPVGARRVSLIKNSDGELLFRSRWIARGFRRKGGKGEDSFAASSPWMLVFCIVVQGGLEGLGRPCQEGPLERGGEAGGRGP